MSYILDALRKNQAEQAGTPVTLQTPTKDSTPMVRVLAVAVLISIVANLALFGWWFWQSGNTTTPVEKAATQTQPITPAPTSNAEQTRSPNAATAAVDEPAARPAPIQPQPRTQPSPVTPAANRAPVRVALNELPAAEQRFYNNLNFTSHIYTPDEEARAVIIDGQRLSTGDAFKGLRIEEITQEGVVFREIGANQTRLVDVSIVDQWSRP